MLKIIRGGSFYYGTEYIRLPIRYGGYSEGRDYIRGFRIVRTVQCKTQ